MLVVWDVQTPNALPGRVLASHTLHVMLVQRWYPFSNVHLTHSGA